VSGYDDPASTVDVAVALAVSPDGQALFVTGRSYGTVIGLDHATVAYRT